MQCRSSGGHRDTWATGSGSAWTVVRAIQENSGQCVDAWIIERKYQEAECQFEAPRALQRVLFGWWPREKQVHWLDGGHGVRHSDTWRWCTARCKFWCYQQELARFFLQKRPHFIQNNGLQIWWVISDYYQVRDPGGAKGWKKDRKKERKARYSE